MKDKLLKLLDNSYSPYSKFAVSSIAVMKDGNEFPGVNVEDASTRVGVCAERCAMFNAIANGYKKGDFKEINVMVSSGNIGTPCFSCRQLMLEFMDETDTIKCWDTKGNYQIFTVKDLCPYPFGEEDLKK